MIIRRSLLILSLAVVVVTVVIGIAVTGSGSTPLRLSLGQVLTADPVTGRSESIGRYLQGEPIRISISMQYPAAMDAARRAHNAGEPATNIPTLRLRPANARWTDFLALEFRHVRGSSVSEALRGYNWRTAVWWPSEKEALAEEIGSNGLGLPLTLPPEVTQALTPGKYSVQAVFDTRAAPGSGFWKGRVVSDVMEFVIEAVTDAKKEAEVCTAQAQFHQLLRPDLPRAEALARRATELDPTGHAHWYCLGEVLAAARKDADAIAAYERYLELAPPDPHKSTPTRGLVPTLIRRLRERLEQAAQ